MRKGWTESTLGEVALVRRERMDPSRIRPDTELIYWSIPGLDEANGPQITRASEIGSHKFCVQNDAILYSLLNPRIPRFALAGGGINVVCSTEFAVLEPTQEITIEFLGVIVSSIHFQYLIGALANGTTKSRERVKANDLEKVQFLLPPLAEQKRIVDVVSSVDAYIDALQQQTDSARVARNAVLHDLLSSDVVSWTEAKLGEVLSLLTDGSHFSPAISEEGLPYVTVRDVKNGLVDTQSCAKISPDSFNELVKNGCAPEVGDVLFSKDGTVGRVALVVPGPKFVVLSSLAILRPNTKLVSSEFLAIAITSNEFQNAATGSKTGLAIKRVVLKVLRELEFRYPSLAEQKRIVEIVSAMDEVIQSTEQAVLDAKALRSGLLSDLLSGNHEIPASYDSLMGAA